MSRGADKEILERHSTFNKNLMFGMKCYPITNITCKKICYFLISTIQKPPTSIDYWTGKLNLNLDTEWDKVFLIPRRATIETKIKIFQYKISNNILYLNKKLCKMGLVETPLCSFC